MIKEVDVIPVKAKPKSRASSIREDIKDAFIRKIKRFEFVGEVYNTCKDYSQQVREEANRFFLNYFKNVISDRMNEDDVRVVHARTYERAYSVYRQTDDKGIVHVYMEIYYEDFEAIIKDWMLVLQKGHR